MARVFVCRNLWPEVLARLSAQHEATIWKEDNLPRSALLSIVRDIEGLLVLGSDIYVDREVIEAAPRLSAVSNYGVGYSNIDVAILSVRGIPLGYTPHAVTEATADLAMALLLASARRIVDADSFVRRGQWLRGAHLDVPGVSVNHATLGLVGLGRIGLEVAKRALAFNMQVVYFSRTRKEELEKRLGLEWAPHLHDMLGKADFVLVTADLNPRTHHLIGVAEFAAMKSTATLINVSRGAVVDEKALYQALQEKRIRRAALDVIEVEPIQMNNPLLALDNVILTPHIGTCIPEVRKKMLEVAVDNLLAGLEGKPMPYCANPEVYRKASP
jgi:glyoxylate reductase